jgi:DNA gyrase/topoisomerase IV, subunit A
MSVGDKTGPEIDDFTENHTDTTVSFTVKATKENIDKWEKEKEGLLGHFKLKGSLSTSCMYLFDQEGRIIKYETPEEIISAFYDVRLEFYGKRKALLVDKLQTEQRKLSNKARFVEEVCTGDLVVSNRKRTVILAELQQRGYETFVPTAKDANNSEDEEDEAAEAQLSDAELAKGYEYLLGMKIWSLTFEKAQELRSQLAEKTKQLQELEATAPTHMWLNDLDAIEVALDERHALMVEAAQNEQKAQKKGAAHRVAQGKKKKAAATKQAKKKKAGEWGSDMETSDEDDKIPARKPAAARKPVVAKKPLKVVPPKAAAGAKAPADPSPVEETANRLSQSLHVSPPPKKVGTTKRTSSPVLDSDLSEVEVVKKQPVAQKKTTIALPKKKKSFDDSDDDSDAMNFSEEEFTTAAAPAARKAAAVVKKQPALPKKKKPSFDESGDDSDAMNFSEEESTTAAAAPVARPARRARPTKTYVESSGSESDDYEASDDDE